MILITGASGFVGTYLAKELSRQNVKQVVCADIVKPRGTVETLSEMFREEGADYPFEFLDITSPLDLLRVIRKYSIHTVLHCASLRGPEAQSNPMKSLKVDVQGLMNILELARLNLVHKIIYLSSIVAYGPPSQYSETVFTEEVVPRPITVYGITKLFNENMGLVYHKNYGVDFVAVRLSNVFGAGRTLGTTALLSIMISDAIEGKKTTAPFGDQLFDWIHVEDATAAIYRAMNSTITTRRIFNITGTPVSMREVASSIKHILPEASIDIRDGMVSDADGIQLSPWAFDATLTRQALDWAPRSIEEGIRATIDMSRLLSKRSLKH